MGFFTWLRRYLNKWQIKETFVVEEIQEDKIPHSSLKNVGPNDHHEAFTMEQHSLLDHTGLPGVSTEKPLNLVTKPDLVGPEQVSFETTNQFTITASNSKTAFQDDGASIFYYEWIINNSYKKIGNSITIQFTQNDDQFEIMCRAVDTYFNYSDWSKHTVTISANKAPTINNVFWSNGVVDSTGAIYPNYQYKLNIIATDPDNDQLTYLIDSCSLQNVIIIDEGNGVYTFDFSNVTLTEINTTFSIQISVRDSYNNTTTKVYDFVIKKTLPSGQTGIIAGGTDYQSSITTISSISYMIINNLSNFSYFGNLTKKVEYAGGSSNGPDNKGFITGGLSRTDFGDIKNFEIERIDITIPSNSITFSQLHDWNAAAVTAIDNNFNQRTVIGSDDYYDSINNVTKTKLEYFTMSFGQSGFFGDLSSLSIRIDGSSNGINDKGVFIGGQKINYLNDEPNSDCSNLELFFNNVLQYITISNLSNSNDFGELSNYFSESNSTSNLTNNKVITFGGTNKKGNCGLNLKSIIRFDISSSHATNIEFSELNYNSFGTGAFSNGLDDRAIYISNRGSVNGINEYATISQNSNSIEFGSLGKRITYTSSFSNS